MPGVEMKKRGYIFYMHGTGMAIQTFIATMTMKNVFRDILQKMM